MTDERPLEEHEKDRELDESLPGGSYSGGAATDEEHEIDGSGAPDDPSAKPSEERSPE